MLIINYAKKTTSKKSVLETPFYLYLGIMFNNFRDYELIYFTVNTFYSALTAFFFNLDIAYN